MPFAASRFTLYSTARAPFVTPYLNSCPEFEERDHAGYERQPKSERSEHEHGDHREPSVDAERGERADHPTLHPADATRDRQQVAEHPDEEGLDQHGERRRLPEGVEG